MYLISIFKFTVEEEQTNEDGDGEGNEDYDEGISLEEEDITNNQVDNVNGALPCQHQ